MQVLIVDDIPLNFCPLRWYLKQIFQDKLLLTEAAGGEEGLKTVIKNNGNYDVVFLDLTMRGRVSGCQALSQMRALGFTHLPYIGSVNQDEAKERYLKAGFYEIVHKPTNRETLETVFSKLGLLLIH